LSFEAFNFLANNPTTHLVIQRNKRPPTYNIQILRNLGMTKDGFTASPLFHGASISVAVLVSFEAFNFLANNPTTHLVIQRNKRPPTYNIQILRNLGMTKDGFTASPLFHGASISVAVLVTRHIEFSKLKQILLNF
jgi:uncharacterized membrane protein YagU involved in acid resistance